MVKIRNIVILLIVCISMGSCGNLLEELGIEPTLIQKMRGIWLVGGLSSEYITSTVGQVDLFDPVKNEFFQEVTTIPTPVSFAGVASCGGKIYVIGGFDSAGICQSIVQIYNVATDTWSAGSSLGAARANIDAVSIYDKVYIIGGTVNNADNTTFAMVNQANVYDTVSDTWNPLPTAPGNNVNATCFALNDIIYFLGGRTNVTTVSTGHNGYMVSLPTPSLTVGTELVLTTMSARIGMAGVLYTPSGGAPLEILIGGYSTLTGVTGNFIFNSDTTYNPVAWAQVRYLFNQFTTSPWLSGSTDYPHTVGFASAAVYNDTIYCFGGAVAAGAGNLTTYNDTNALDLTGFPAGTWVARANMPTARFGHTALTIKQ